MHDILEACRQRFGPVPRPLTRYNTYLKMDLPLWLFCYPFDKLWMIYRHQKKLLARGHIVWGALVQANELLFRQGGQDCPAEVIYSSDPYYDTHPAALSEVASRLFALKGTQPSDAPLAQLAKVITNEATRPMALRLPEHLTKNHPIDLSTIMVHRPHLPDECLHGSLFPLLIAPDLTPAVMILPSRYWPEEMVADWGRR